MGGGLLQLVAYGAQDVYLTGNPQITFWKVVYRRHTNFAMEAIEQSFNGTAGYGKRVTAQISRNGDLIHRMWLQMTMSAVTGTNAAFRDKAGLAAIKSVELEIGGQRIDKHYGEWMHIWNELSLPAGKKDGYEQLVGGEAPATTDTAAGRTLFVPLEFWFCRNPGLALPLIALQYHDVKVNIEFDELSVVAAGTGLAGTLEARLWVDYVFLDTDERRRFSQMSHEYLIDQLQFTGDESTLSNIKLSFNHPVKELVWVLKASGDSKLEYNGGMTLAKLQLNGHDRFAERPAAYFSLVQPFQHHENVPVGKGIYVYSFALKPEEHQPSGTLNMSRIDTASLKLTSGAVSAKVFASNYNVLRIMSGMGGLAFAN